MVDVTLTGEVPREAGETNLAGGKPASPIGQLSWALYEWARDPYYILVNIYVFAPYFTNVVVGDPIRGQELWSYTSSLAGFILAVLGPIFGSIADAGGRRKPWLILCTVIAVPAMGGLWFAKPGLGENVLPLLADVMVVSLFFELSVIFHNAMLPTLSSRSQVGRLSGLALALGNAAGVILFLFVLFAWIWAEHPLFGLDGDSYEPARAMGLLCGLWFGLFSLPLFLLTPDNEGTGLGPVAAAAQGLRTLWHTILQLRRHGNVMLFVIARMIYNDGFTILMTFTGIYAAGIFGWDVTKLTIYGIFLSVAAGIESVIAGIIDDRMGSRRALLLALVGGIIANIVTVSITAHSIFFVVETGDAKIFLDFSLPECVFYLNSLFAALSVVTGLASSRTMMARLAPPDMVGEFFGLFALSGSAIAFMGPLVVGALTGWFHSQQAGLAAVMPFLLIGGVLLFWVREERTKL